jgi:glutamate formiminotransferase
MSDAIAARDTAAARLADELGLPCFLYGPVGPTTPSTYVERTLPELRRDAFAPIPPDVGPPSGHATAGAVAVGARGLLVAWNIWLRGVDLRRTRQISAALRSDSVRTLGFAVSGGTQISCNLVDPTRVTPLDVFDEACRILTEEGFDPSVVDRCELVGLVPRACLERITEDRWDQLDLDEARTIEASAERLGITVV